MTCSSISDIQNWIGESDIKINSLILIKYVPNPIRHYSLIFSKSTPIYLKITQFSHFWRKLLQCRWLSELTEYVTNNRKSSARLYRYWWRMLEATFLVDNYKMLVTASAILVTIIHYLFILASGTNIQKMSSTTSHQHLPIVTNLK